MSGLPLAFSHHLRFGFRFHTTFVMLIIYMCMCRLLYDCKSVKKLHTNDYINTPPVNVAVSRPQRATRSFDTDGYYQL